MIRWMLTKLRGPLCDASGCNRRAVEFRAPLPGHTRGLRWCINHSTTLAALRAGPPRPTDKEGGPGSR